MSEVKVMNNVIESPAHAFSATVTQPGGPAPVRLAAQDVKFWYGQKQILHDIELDMRTKEITALIGPSGCGKTTFLRMINRMCDTAEGARHSGTITLDGENVLNPKLDVVTLRRKVGMVFQKPNPFPEVDLRQCDVRRDAL